MIDYWQAPRSLSVYRAEGDVEIQRKMPLKTPTLQLRWPDTLILALNDQSKAVTKGIGSEQEAAQVKARC